MTDRLAGLRAVVTGASRGIGLAIASEFLREGARVFMVARNPESLGQAARTLGTGVESGAVVTHACDLSECAAIEGMFDAAAAWAGRIDVVVNNAGIHVGRAFTEYRMEEFDRVMSTNVRSVFRLMQLAITHMRSHGGGKIINVSSTAGRWESANQAVYNASKHALNGLTLCAAIENAPHGININAICPGMVETDMWTSFVQEAATRGVDEAQLRRNFEARIPIGRFIQPREVAHVAVWLASAEANGMAGQLVTISGGMRMG